MAIKNLFGFVIELACQGRELGGWQSFSSSTESGEENRVNPENLPGNIPDGKVEIVKISHSQFASALAHFAENLGQKSRQGVAIQVSGKAARDHESIRQGDYRSSHAVQTCGAGNNLIRRRVLCH